MMIRCLGSHRVKIDSFTQQADGLVIGEVTDIANDLVLPIPEYLQDTSKWFEKLLESLVDQNISLENISVMKPYKLDDAAWVANRWVELLDLPLLQKQILMQNDSPILRLEMIHDTLDLDSPKKGLEHTSMDQLTITNSFEIEYIAHYSMHLEHLYCEK